jgi:hypothetical protein
MELAHLRYFVAVAEEGSLTVAAERFWSPNYIQHSAHPMTLAQTDSLSRDQSSWNCRSAERCTSSRKLGHAAG